jgi:membrane-bound serine protease (ClpP class)
MDILLDPNVAYVLLVSGFILALLSIITPGTGLIELSGLFVLVLAGYSAYNIGINPWALVVLILALVPFVYAVRKKAYRTILLGVTIALVIGGSLFLYTNENGWPAVHPLVAVIVSLVVGGFIWLGVDRTLAVMQGRPTHDLGALLQQVGEARTEIHDTGSVQVAGELWTARSEKSIPQGSFVRIVGRDGFVLIVEKAKE